MRKVMAAAMAATVAFAPMAAVAQTAKSAPVDESLFDLSTAPDVAAAMQQLGYRGLVKKGDDGLPYVESSANGQAFTIDLYDCKDEHCASLQLQSYYKPEPIFTPALANEWNSDKRFLKVSIDAKGQLREWLDVSAVGKLTRANFSDVIDWYAQMD